MKLTVKKIPMLALFSASFILIILILTLIGSKPASKPVFVFRVSGGFAGFMLEYTLYENGSLVSKDLKIGGEKKIFLDAEDFNLLRSICGKVSRISPANIGAVQGAADFFTYRLEVDGKFFEWVDPAVAEKELPLEVSDFHKLASAVIGGKVTGTPSPYRGLSEAGEILMEVELDKYACRVNESVKIKITVRNRGSSEFTYSSPTPCHPDVMVSPDINHEVEYIVPLFSKDKICTQVIETRIIPVDGYRENVAVIFFRETGVAHVKIVFPYAAFENKVVEVTIPVFVND
ncbi:MAG: hypothetical protein ACUVQ0_01535 [Thermoproteota archaeon]